MANDLEARIRNVTAVLGPTNTGKTHLAIERMLGHESGMIGLPLRLLAREVYDKIKTRAGAGNVALITGEEKIKPERARYWVSTVEAMPRDIEVDFLAIDEIQLCADFERGHVFTDRLLHARGRSETLLLGAQTMRDAISDLIPGANFITRPRLSKLTYTGEKKITRLPARTAIIAFSAQEVYEIAELIRRQRGGAAVVLGALSPRTRNAQVALYQSGDVEFLVATDAIGMGLNLDVDHIAFSGMRKFDGQHHRNLTAGEIGQIAGRAGRYMNDGTFGVTGSCEAFDNDLVERLESHTFDSVKVLQWRNRKLDFGSIEKLQESLRDYPREARLTRARTADDVAALEALCEDREIADIAATPAAVMKLWETCQIPDYRKISGANHAELVANVFKFIATGSGHIPEDWFTRQVALADRTDGDIDTLSTRLAHIRTWTFVANRPDWLQDPGHWQDRTRQVEDSLSDALHDRLTQRFIDRRTSALMKGMRDKEELNAEISDDGSVSVENHFVGKLKGLRFALDAAGEGIHGKATRTAATQVVARELGMRARRIAAAQSDAFKLTRDGRLLWRDDEIAVLESTDDPLLPKLTLQADENLTEADQEKITARLQTWLKDSIGEKLKPLAEMSAAEDLQGLGRGVAFRLKENIGALKREDVANEINALEQTARAELRKYGLRFGAFNIFFPLLMKPAAADLAATLWILKNKTGQPAALPRPGLTSVAADPTVPEGLYRAYGFHVCGPRAVRLDIIERLADQIRPLLSWRASVEKTEAPPKGSTGDGGFKVTDDMMSILGCSSEELGHVLQSLGFKLERRKVVAPSNETTSEQAQVPAAAPAPAPAEPTSDAAPELVQPSEALIVGPPAEVFEEIWRPRRHQRPEKHHRGRDQNSGPPARQQAGKTESGDAPQRARRERGFEKKLDRPQRDETERGGNRGGGPLAGKHPRGERRQDRSRRPEVVTAGPPKKQEAALDSPFAALAALKASMEKRGDGPGSR